MEVSFFGVRNFQKTTYQWDSRAKGLGVRINKGGLNYVIKYHFCKKSRWMTLCEVELLNIEQARKLAILAKRLAKSGTDPKDTIKLHLNTILLGPGARIDSQMPSITFGEYADIYLDRIRERNRSWYKDRNRIKVYLNDWKQRRLASITPVEVFELHIRTTKKGKYAANRVTEMLRTMFKRAIKWGYLPKNFDSPAEGIDLHEETPRDVFIGKKEIGRMGEAIDRYPDCSAKWAIKFDLYTGLRISEVLKMKWEDVDFQACTLTIPRSSAKNKRPLVLPLSAPLIDLLNSIPKNDIYIFPGKGGGRRLSSVTKPFKIIKQDAGMPHLRVHDLRRTTGCWLTQQTGDIKLVGTVLNQTTQAATEVYSHHDVLSVKAALEEHAKEMEKWLEPGKKSNAGKEYIRRIK